ncbi:PREDICTED: uncharacterized protein LOC108767644 [Trachymyrmex cornetzi]|uniref:uncharacterized protein LOC108767644 n=1 Tax=Trachymyrmex cornetzi TaxID=471704 RepID=UPI00084ED7E6|nr:PREDICTED: uncharacterized protein LOC108767644 [Trachymyrmex cornetzi]
MADVREKTAREIEKMNESILLEMELNLQQRVCIKFCVKNGFNGAKTLEMLRNCFGSDAVKKTTVYEWHERFRSSRESVVNPSRMTNAVASRQHRKPTKTSINRKKVMEKSKMALMAIPTIEFQKCFESWIKRWHKCVAIDGEYFEGDNITFDK